MSSVYQIRDAIEFRLIGRIEQDRTLRQFAFLDKVFLILRHTFGCTLEEISRTLKVSKRTIERWSARLKKKIKLLKAIARNGHRGLISRNLNRKP